MCGFHFFVFTAIFILWAFTAVNYSVVDIYCPCVKQNMRCEICYVGGVQRLLPSDDMSARDDNAHCNDRILIVYGDRGYSPKSIQFEVK